MRKSKKYQNLVRWFNSILTEHDDALGDITATYVGKRGAGKPATAKSKENQGVTQSAKSVNGDTSDKSVSKSSSFEVDLPDAEPGNVKLRFAPEPSGFLHIGHSKAALLNKYFAEHYGGLVIV